MRQAVLIPLFLVSLLTSCKPAQELSPEIDILSQEGCNLQSESVFRQADEMRKQALDTLSTRERNGEYSRHIRSQLNLTHIIWKSWRLRSAKSRIENHGPKNGPHGKSTTRMRGPRSVICASKRNSG